MLGALSIGKILVLAIVIAIAFFLMRTLSKANAKDPPPVPRGNPRTVELTACPRCGTFLPKGTWCTCDRK
jgi:hypothetical protein